MTFSIFFPLKKIRKNHWFQRYITLGSKISGNGPKTWKYANFYPYRPKQPIWAYFDVFGPFPEIFDPSAIYRWNQWFFLIFFRGKKIEKVKKNFFFIRVHPKKRGPWDPTSRAARAPKFFLGVPVGSHNGKNLPATWNSKKAVFLNRLSHSLRVSVSTLNLT